MLTGLGSSKNNKDAAISVVMATYNGALFLEEQIESILAQSLPPVEIIVCDDQSTDSTVQILQKYAEHCCLTFSVNNTKLGVVANFKKAVSLASKENYIALSDQDDIWLPEKLEKSMMALKKIEEANLPALVYSDLVLVDHNNQLLQKSFATFLGNNKYQHCLETLLFGNFVTGCTVLMNPIMRNYFSDIPIHKNINHDSWMALIGYSFGKANALTEKPIRYRKHSENVTIANIKKTNRFIRIMNHLKYSLQTNHFLEEELVLVRYFFEKYEKQLSHKDANIMLQFLSLTNGSYLKKKMAFEKAFISHWVKRF
jgi:glycosyltransferase involved in cell wall biosynthesis